MLTLWLSLATLLSIALLFVIIPCYKKTTTANFDRKKTNTLIYQERLALLKEQSQDLSSFAEQEAHLAQQLLSDISSAQAPISSHKAAFKPLLALFFISSFISIFSGLCYYHWGASQALEKTILIEKLPKDLASWGTPIEIAQRFKALLAQHPDDAQGWFLLGRLYFGLQQLPEAEQAFANAYHLQPNNPQYMLQYVQALYVQNQYHLSPQALSLLQEVLSLEPDNIEAKNLLALDFFSEKNYQAAIDIWRQIVVLLPPQHPDAQAILAAINRTQQLLAEQQPAVNLPHIMLNIELAPHLKTKVKPKDSVFIVARAAKIPIPLAALKKTVADLPLTVSLSDQNAMSTQAKLSDAKDLKIVVRISKNDQPLAQAGDLQAEINVPNWQTQTVPFKVIIDHVIP